MPEQPALPLLIYRNALADDVPDLAAAFERTFSSNGWPPAWRYTIYDYPHYHSTSHEVIGIYRGEADVRLGDSAGLTAQLRTRDVVLIPAGVSHQRLRATPDFHGVGAYPKGCAVDEQRIDRNDLEGSVRRIAAIPIPDSDPVFGRQGLLRSRWQEDART